MTSTLERPPLVRPGRPAAHRRSPLTGGLLAALWAALGGLVALALPVLAVWAADARSGAAAGEAVRSAGQLWLLAHSSSLTVPGGTVGLAPLGLAALPFLLLVRAGAHAARECGTGTWREVGLLAGAVAAPYAVVAAAVSSLSTTDAVRPAPVQSLAGALVLSALAVCVGAVRTTGLRPRVSPRSHRSARAALLAVCGLAGAGALLAGGSLLLHLGDARDVMTATQPGIVGGLALLLLCVVLLPNAVVWGIAWWAGPGFAVGAGTVVGPFAHDLGAVPALPLLAALPASAPPTWVAPLVLLVPLGLGVLAGRVVVAPGTPPSAHGLGPVGAAAVDGAAVGALTGLAVALLCVVSGGPLGDARLSEVGPTWWLVGLVVALQVGAAAALSAALWARARS